MTHILVVAITTMVLPGDAFWMHNKSYNNTGRAFNPATTCPPLTHLIAGPAELQGRHVCLWRAAVGVLRWEARLEVRPLVGAPGSSKVAASVHYCYTAGLRQVLLVLLSAGVGASGVRATTSGAGFRS